MNNIETEDHFRTSLEHFKRIYEIEPQILAYDMHPNYRSSGLALEMKGKVKYPIQHHHAHMASCMAENGMREHVIRLILDGTGYGSDGRILGFEVLTGDYLDFQREFHLTYTPLPGGRKGQNRVYIARRFHDTLVAILRETVGIVNAKSSIKKVVFSGGVWHNWYLQVIKGIAGGRRL